MLYTVELDYPMNLIAAVLELDLNKKEDRELFEEISLIDDLRGSVEYVLHTLTDKERYVLHHRYAMNRLLTDIAEEEGVTKAAINSIEKRALKKLGYPDRVKYLTIGIKGMIHNISLDYFEKFSQLNGKLLDVCKLYESKADKILETIGSEANELLVKERKIKEQEKIVKELIRDNNTKVKLEQLNLTTRPFNLLKRSGCNSLADVLNLGCEGLRKVEKMGRHSYDEIISKLGEFGYTVVDDKFCYTGELRDESSMGLRQHTK